MRLSRIGGNTIFRLALVYAVLFSAATMVLFGIVYWRTTHYLDHLADDLIHADVEDLGQVFARGGIPALSRAIAERLQEDRNGDLVYFLADAQGTRLAGDLAQWPVARAAGDFVTFTFERRQTGPLQPHRARAEIIGLAGGLRLLAGRDINDGVVLRRTILRALGWALALTLAAAVAVGVPVILGAMRRLEEIARTSRGIIAGDLSHRVPVRGSGDDFDGLAANLNAMLDRIEALMMTVKGVSDNIAHDLRTPLARVRGRLEQARVAPPPREAFAVWADETIAHLDAVLDTFEGLLKIAEIEAGAPRPSFTRVALAAVLSDVAEFYEPMAEQKGQRLVVEIAAVRPVEGQRDLLFRALANLVDNAIKYTPDGGRIALRLGMVAGQAQITIADNGPGIPESARAKVFQRLYRLEESRSMPGSGLGLSLVAAVAELHGARVSLEDEAPGLRVRLVFPKP